MLPTKINFTVLDRFLRYVQIDTEADPMSNTSPSSEKQKVLSRLLVEELKSMGVEDAITNEYGYVYATILANTDQPDVPVIAFCAHIDTAPDCSGKDVKPIVHKDYQGQDLVLPDDTSIVLRMSEHKNLKNQIGNDVVTASGKTLLGGDDKAGVAEIMDAAYQLVNNPEIKHGVVKLLFTTDEEIGRGVDHVDVGYLGAKYCYTLDGGEVGSLEDETFSADAVTITIHGVSAHPGYAKGYMENSMKIASEIIASLPKDRLCPEATEGYQGFVHPTKIEGALETTKLSFIIRDFTDEKLQEHEAFLKGLVENVMKNYPNSTFDFQVKEQYRNMKKVLDTVPFVTEIAEEAIKRAGLTPIKQPIRGGTDGSRLSFMGLPCPNIFAAENAIHGKQEWVSAQDMQKAVETILHICEIWAERGR